MKMYIHCIEQGEKYSACDKNCVLFQTNVKTTQEELTAKKKMS